MGLGGVIPKAVGAAIPSQYWAQPWLGVVGLQVHEAMETSKRAWSTPPSLLEEDGSESGRWAQDSVFSSLNSFPLDQSSVTVAMTVAILVPGTLPAKIAELFFNLLGPVTMKLRSTCSRVGLLEACLGSETVL